MSFVRQKHYTHIRYDISALTDQFLLLFVCTPKPYWQTFNFPLTTIARLSEWNKKSMLSLSRGLSTRISQSETSSCGHSFLLLRPWRFSLAWRQLANFYNWLLSIGIARLGWFRVQCDLRYSFVLCWGHPKLCLWIFPVGSRISVCYAVCLAERHPISLVSWREMRISLSPVWLECKVCNSACFWRVYHRLFKFLVN